MQNIVNKAIEKMHNGYPFNYAVSEMIDDYNYYVREKEIADPHDPIFGFYDEPDLSFLDEQQKVYFAGVVDYLTAQLTEQYNVVSWTDKSEYKLDIPKFPSYCYPNKDGKRGEIREWLIENSPIQFKRRNIFISPWTLTRV